MITNLFVLVVTLNPEDYVCSSLDYGLPEGLLPSLKKGNAWETILLLFSNMFDKPQDKIVKTIMVLPTIMLLLAEDKLGVMVDQTDAMCLKRMMELAVTDIWHADRVELLEDALLSATMLGVLEATLEKQVAFAQKSCRYGDHLKEVLEHYSAHTSAANATALHGELQRTLNDPITLAVLHNLIITISSDPLVFKAPLVT